MVQTSGGSKHGPCREFSVGFLGGGSWFMPLQKWGDPKVKVQLAAAV